MVEKELFHEVSVRVPLIIYAPWSETDATRSAVSNTFVEATARKNRVTVTDDGVRGMREGKDSAGIMIGT